MGEALQPKTPISNDPKDWKSIPGFEGRYECDRYGRVRRLFKTRGPRLMTQYKHRTDHRSRGNAVYVKLTDEYGKAHGLAVGRLIYTTWKGPIKHGIYHKNGMLHDNALDNLIDVSQSELGRLTGGRAGSKAVMQFDEKGNCTAFYKSAREAGRQNYVSYQTVMDRCNRKTVRDEYIGGYTYRWAEEMENEE